MPATIVDSHPTDPSGEDRERKITYKSINRGVVEAEVQWGEKEEKPAGKVSLTTAFAPVELTI